MRISIHSYLNMNINVKQIIDVTYVDLSNNSNSYLPFFNITLNIYYDQLYRYFCLQQWNCNIGDIIPLAIANTFNIRIVIKSTQLLPVIIKLFTLSTSMPYIIVHYANNHYSGSESKQLCTQTLDGSCTNCLRQTSTLSHLTEVSFVKSITWNL